MRGLFNGCINDVVGLVQEQIKQLSEVHERRIKVSPGSTTDLCLESC